MNLDPLEEDDPVVQVVLWVHTNPQLTVGRKRQPVQ